jgi:hypothetical protein
MSEGNRLFERTSRRWEDNIKICPEGIGCMDCRHLAQHWDQLRAFVNTVMNRQVI